MLVLRGLLILFLFVSSLWSFSVDLADFNTSDPDKTYSKVEDVVSKLVENPYTFSPNIQDTSALEKKILINRKSGYVLATERDSIKKDIIDLNNRLNKVFSTYANGLRNFKKEEEITSDILKIDFPDYSEKHIEVLNSEKNSTKKSELIEQAKKIRSLSQSAKIIRDDLLKIISGQLDASDSIIETFSINDAIKKINERFSLYNYRLRSHGINLDLGRSIVGIFLILFFMMLGWITNKVLPFIIKKMVGSSSNDYDSPIWEELFNSLRTPIFTLMFAMGVDTSVGIYLYPEHASQTFIRMIWIFYIYSAAAIVANFLDIFFQMTYEEMAKRRIEIVNAILRLAKVLVFLMATVFLLIKMGVDPMKLLTSLGIGALAVALALKDTLVNFFSGLKLIWDDAFSPGDWIAVTGEKEGTVMDISFMRTLIRGFDNSLIVIPNAKIASTSYVNWSRRKIGRQIKIDIGVTYDSKMEDVENAIKDIYAYLKESPLIAPDTADFDRTIYKKGRIVKIGNEIGLKNTLMVHLTEFADYYININIYAFSKTVVWGEWRDAKEQVLKDVWDIIHRNNLQFAFPTQTIELKKQT